MSENTQLGLYGKLPAHGDFIFRNLNSNFITPWDEWMQRYIAGSREQLGDAWLDIYLTSPIWRFVFSSGVIDDKVWAGLMMPSVDRVGRYFPISVVKPFPRSVSPVNILTSQEAWFRQLEDECLIALDGDVDADGLVQTASQIELQALDCYEPTSHLGEKGSMVFGLQSGFDDPAGVLLPYALNARLSAELSSFSLWQTSGSELIAPVLFCCQGLPPISGLTSMLDGQWQQRNWKIPYNPQTVTGSL